MRTRKFRGTILVRHDQWTAEFFRGKRGREAFATVGNVGVAYDFVDILRDLGHVVEVLDESDDREED